MDYWYPNDDRIWKALKKACWWKRNGLCYAAFSTGCISWYGKWKFGD